MTAPRIALAAAGALSAAFLISRGTVTAQMASPFEGAEIQHVGLVIRDINKAVTDYAGFLGVPVPKVGEVKNIQLVDSFKGGPVSAKIAMFGIGEVLLDLVEPMGGPSPWRNHVERVGEGLQHICIEVNDVAPAVAELVKRGGIQESSSYVNMIDTLGITFEVMKKGTMKAAGYVNLPTPTKFAAGPVDHVGIVVRDAAKAGRLMADILRVAPPKPVVRMGGTMTSLDTKPIGMEFIEPAAGANPWREHLDRTKGPGIHHLAVKVKAVQEDIAYAQKHGGKVTVPPTNGRGVVDIGSRPFPFSFELMER
jgi:catechol 2,3-dioxygenase-like lactoylglutathione lyase family enzyme